MIALEFLTHQLALPCHTVVVPARYSEALPMLHVKPAIWIFPNSCSCCVTGQSNKSSSLLSVHELTGVHNWPVLTGKRHYAIPPTQTEWPILLSWLLAMDGSDIIRIYLQYPNDRVNPFMLSQLGDFNGLAPNSNNYTYTAQKHPRKTKLQKYIYIYDSAINTM